MLEGEMLGGFWIFALCPGFGIPLDLGQWQLQSRQSRAGLNEMQPVHDR